MQSLQRLPEVRPNEARRHLHRWIRPVQLEIPIETKRLCVSRCRVFMRARTIRMRRPVCQRFIQSTEGLWRELPFLLWQFRQPRSGQLRFYSRNSSWSPVLWRSQQTFVSTKHQILWGHSKWLNLFNFLFDDAKIYYKPLDWNEQAPMLRRWPFRPSCWRWSRMLVLRNSNIMQFCTLLYI